MKRIIATMLTLAIPFATFAQLKVTAEGKVCIVRDSVFRNSILTIGNVVGGNFGNIGTNSQISFTSTSGVKSIGMLSLTAAKTNNYASAIGVMGIANNGYSGRIYGVLGAIPASKVGAGIYGSAGTSGSAFGKLLTSTYAGYFEGATCVDGTLTATEVITPSDIRLKENIISIADEEVKTNGSTLGKLMGMNVIKYTYKPKTYVADKDGGQGLFEDEESAAKAEEAAKQEIRRMAEQQHYGLSAQELQEIYPDLVREAQDGTLGVNYVELVPILIRSIQELKQELDAVRRSGAKMTRSAFSGDEDEMSTSASQNMLYQNTPNPFKEQTTIRFSLADDVTDAAICIFDMTGKILKKLPVSPGETSVKINGWELGEGMFLYTLMVNGQEVDTKKMIITR